MPQSYTCLNYHLVFSTKSRVTQIEPDWQARLYKYIGGVLRAHGGCLLSAGGMPDHIHLLASISKEQAIADALRIIKSNSSGWIHDTLPGQKEFAWQTGYAAFAVSYSNLEKVRKYVLKQKEHHRKKTFKEEFVALLEKHEIDYDKRYLWD